MSSSGPAFVDIHNNPRVDLIRGHVGYVYVLLSHNNYLISGSGDSTIKVSVKEDYFVDVVVGCGIGVGRREIELFAHANGACW